MEIVSEEELVQTANAIAESTEALESSSNITDALTSAANSSFVQQTSSIVNTLKDWFKPENILKICAGLLVIFIMWIIYKVIIRLIKKIPQEKLTPQKFEIIKKVIKYLFFISIVMYVLSLFGIKLSAIWGAAGITGVAIGFAAQTTLSNLISGLFVLTEGSIHVGDSIALNDISGIVDSISLLSTRIHTFDNQMVRIPNSTIINNNLINNSYHGKRRITVTLDVTYKTDLKLALKTFENAAVSCPTVLKNPAPNTWIDGYTDSGINITVAAWFKPKDYIQTKTDLHIAILEEMKKAKIETPYPKMDINLITTETKGKKQKVIK